MEAENSDGIIIEFSGLDGDTIYQAINKKSKKVIIAWLGINNFPQKFIKTYPNFSKKISEYCEGKYPGNLPKEIEFPIEPAPRGRLIEKISSEYLKI
jgi:hypothetical protein